MKSCLLILGDLHIKDHQWINNEIIKKVGNTFNNQGDIQEIAIVVAGDLAFSGKINEYKKVGNFFGILTKVLKEKMKREKPIPFYLVPGNHDIDYKDENVDREDILKIIQDPNKEEYVEEELKKFNNFYKLAQYNNCFVKDLLLDKKFFKNGLDGTIQINLLNSELFSSFKDHNGDDDKGVHFFPEQIIQNLNKSRHAKYNITVMHRSPDWFEYNSMKKLKSKIFSHSNILIYGHDHLKEMSEIKKEDDDICIINPGLFDFSEGQFNFTKLIIDLDEECCDISNYTWVPDKESFIMTSNIKGELKEINNDLLKPDVDFIENFYKIDDNNLKDVFVFPDLNKINDKEMKTVNNIEDFFEEIKTNKVVYVEGAKNLGKTSFCKALFNKSTYFKKTPLYIDMNNIRKKYDKMIKDAFVDEYSYELSDWEKFQQLSKEEKIVIVDNFDAIDHNVSEISSNLETQFGYVVYVYKPNEKGNLIEDTKKNIISATSRYQILPLYLRKRKELIKKLLSNYSAINSEEIDDKVEEINKFIVDQINIFSIDPAFITNYVKYFVRQNNIVDIQDNIFNEVFESNIIEALKKVVPINSISEYLKILELIAHYAHFSKKSPFESSAINEIIKKYNEEFFMTVDCVKFKNNLIKANILEILEGDMYRFTNDSYLAYFTARSINKRFNEENGKDDLEFICRNLCFNINGEILLFLSYIISSEKLLQYIYNNAKSIFENWQELDLDNTSISFLNNNTAIEDSISMPTKKDQSQNDINMEEQEKRIVKNLEIKAKSIYDDYDESKIGSQQYFVVQAVRYLELVSKILPNFNHDLKKEEKLEIVKDLYSFPNKLCNQILLNVDKNITETIDDLMKYCETKKINLTKTDILYELEKSAQYFILNCFDRVARLSTNEKTINILDTQNMNTINYKILNIMMHENLGKFKPFAEIADKIYTDSKNPIVKTMIKLIIRKHFLVNKNLKQVGYVQMIADKYFGNNRKYIK